MHSFRHLKTALECLCHTHVAAWLKADVSLQHTCNCLLRSSTAARRCITGCIASTCLCRELTVASSSKAKSFLRCLHIKD